MNLHTKILKNLFFLGATSIGELSLAVGKSIPITTKGVKDLVKRNFILNVGLTESTGGRKAFIYQINKEKVGLILAISIERFSTTLDIFNLDKERIMDQINIDIPLKDEKSLYDALIIEIRKILNQYKKNSFLGIGIVTPGYVDVHKKINNSHLLESPLYQLAANFEEEFGINTFIENDSTAIAIIEKYFGKAKNSTDTLVINLTWGLGLGMLIDNRIFRGQKGYAGEFSHIPLGNTNSLCQCGKKGCLEVEASLQSIIDEVTKRINEGETSVLSNHIDNLTFENLENAYKKGDPLTIEAIKKVGHMLGKGIATLIHIISPEKIILAGKGLAFGNILLSEIKSSIHLYCIPRLSEQTTIELSDLTDILPLAAASTAVEQIQKIATS